VGVHPSTAPAAPAATASPTAVDDAELASHLRLSVIRLSRRLRQESGTGLTPSQLSALAVVDRRGPLTLGRLAEVEHVAPPTVTRLVLKLVSAGLVERRPDPHDGRVVNLVVTERGRALMEESRRRKTAFLAAGIGRLDSHARQRLVDALGVLDELLRAEQAP